MRLIPIRLAPKLNLSLLVFMLVLGAAVATLVLFGFRRTQHNATSESRQRLEQQGREVLLGFANLNAYIGQTQFAATSGIGQEAARYLVETKQQGASIPWDSGTLALTSDGQRYDADPARRTDVRVPAGVPADVADRDLRDSAALDAVFPPLLANFGAAPGDKSIGPISIYFRSVNNVLREYPAIGGGGGALSATGEPAVPPGLDPQANPGRRTVWSAPHAGIGTPGQVMTSYTPVYDGDEFRGVIGVDISLQRLVEQINGIGVTPNGFAFYLGADGSILRSAAYDRIQTALAGAPNGGLAQTVAAMRGGGNGVGRIQLDGRDMYIAYSPLTGVGGSLALVSPVSDVTAQAAAVDSAISREGNQTLIFTLATMAGFLVVALAGGAWMYRRMLLAPISGLVRGTQAVTEGDLNVRIPVRSSDELGMLADSFNRMTQQIEQRRMALRDEISERERTAEALREREEQYRSVFESTTDGLIIAELGGTVAEVNPAACAMHGYTREEFLALPPRAHIAPEFHPLREEMVEQVTAGGEFRTRSRNVRKDGSTFPTEVLGTVLTYRGRPHVLAVVRDITEQVEAERVLEQRVRDRTNEIATLLEITQNIGSTLELRPLLDVILLQVKRVVNFDLAAFLLVQGREVNVLAVNTQHASDVETLMRVRIPVEESSPLWQALSRGEAVNLGDLGADSAIARSTRSGMRGRVGPTATRVRSWLGVPLLSKGQLIGMLAITSEQQDFFGETDVQLAMAVAGQAAFAVESARLFEQTQERTKELATLLEVAAHVGSTLELRPLAQRILQETAVVIGYDRATFALAEDGMLEVVAVHAAQGPADAGLLEQIGERYPVGGEPLVWDELLAGRPVIVDDTHDDSPLAQAYRAAVGPRHVARSQGRNWMAVPLTLQGKLSGLILMTKRTERFFTQRHAGLALGIASQAAVGIENARLYDRVQVTAALEERQRLARELHDSVSQALYGIGLGARTAKAVLERDPARAQEPIDYVLSLAEAGLSEMRALIFELRPESLETEGLVAALEKQVAATSARYGLRVDAHLGAEPSARLEAKEAIYRIAQEALHNTVKHAHATSVELRLTSDDGYVQLDVGDDGRGFDAGGDFPGHLGLKSMRERIARLRGTLEITSAAGAGTHIRARIPV